MNIANIEYKVKSKAPEQAADEIKSDDVITKIYAFFQ